MTSTIRRVAAVLAAAALGASSLATTAQAADPRGKGPGKVPPAVCKDYKTSITLLAFNDFHGRIAPTPAPPETSPDTTAFFTTLEKERAAAGEASTIVFSSGDSIGASLFPSMIQADEPTLDILNAADLAASAVGNHELDRGWNDFSGRVQPYVKFPYLAANLYQVGTTKPAVPAYTIVTVKGLKVALVGAVTGDLRSLVSTEVFDSVDIGDPVAAVNRVTAQLKDGKTANGEADVVIASYHEGAAVSTTLDEGIAASEAFASIANRTDPRVAAIFTAHTHQAYTWNAPIPGTTKTRPVIQSSSYAALIGRVTLTVDSNSNRWTRGQVCSYTQANVTPLKSADALAVISKYPRALEIQTITNQAIKDASVIGAEVVADSPAPIARAVAGDRNRESAMSNMVADMFFDVLSAGDPEFIGVQNPGGTRADLPAGDITYSAAAAILPFANTLMTTQLTGAQVKTMLEQQWQRDDKGNVPGRPYLQLGLSKNVSYTYDELLPEGSRITSIWINGAPIDPAKLYTLGSGNFLITGGDNFHVFRSGVNAKDTGKSDLDSWATWLKAEGTVSPEFAKRAVSVHVTPATLTAGGSTTFAVGVPNSVPTDPPKSPLAPDTLNMTANKGVPVVSTSIEATLDGVVVGSAAVAAGSVPALTVTVPAATPAGPATLVLTTDAGTVVSIPVTIA